MQPTVQTLTLFLSLAVGPVAAQTPFAEGLLFPQRLLFTPLGNILASEGGTANTPNTARISIVNRQGTRRSLLEGLPGAPGHGIAAFGPGGMGLDGRTLYLLIGEGDLQVGPPFSINLNGPSSPLFPCVLQIQFSADVDAINTSFRLSPGDHWVLIDGYDVALRNADGDRATVHLLTTFRPLMRNILGGTAPHRPSDPYGAWLDAANNALYVVDPSAETLTRISTVTGAYQVLTRFQSDERSGAFVDTVPTAACPLGDGFLISFLSAAPFPAGTSSVRLWKPSDGTWSRLDPLITGLSMTNDMICLRGGSIAAPRVVTVEYTATPPANPNTPAGRVQLVDGSQRRVIAQNLPLPTTAAQDPITGDIFVATLTGSIFRFPLP